MANSPQKSKDATQEALSAIQEALSIRQSDPREPTAFGPAEEVPTADLFHDDTAATAWDADDLSPRRAANDDRANIGQILQTLRRRPARAPYIAATVTGIVWTAGALATAYLYADELQYLFRDAARRLLPP